MRLLNYQNIGKDQIEMIEATGATAQYSIYASLGCIPTLIFTQTLSSFWNALDNV